ncbi:ATP-binding cassette domain-containing protein [Candidatus Acetothermia bacterium]|jgi:ATP-binding cassette subfamily F protein 3|nr:ATP-binding cassette domain-containing protein [Candidatus Acetothermia bacterium]MCI2432157.1 ATP-binding cassette domain-containing protein [Candidatus Acetothermia bacterium]MCI2436150.1 ATP-binding cassette domain-containing protein [Candidatus Acetothermia bacterium]
MSLIVTDGLMHRYGGEIVFENVSVALHRGDRVALIGLNGSGKSTLLQILARRLEPAAGRVAYAHHLRIGYLAQEPELCSEKSLYDEMLGAFADVLQQEQELQELENKLAQGDAQTALLERYDELLEAFCYAGGYEYKSRIAQVLSGLGFSAADTERPVSQLSGGERTRAALARLLLEAPELLLLDEPTNHLDLSGLEWLEEYLSRWKGAFIVVSHDRYFLDRLANKIWELEFGRLHEYPGNYSQYSALRLARIERQWKLYEEQQEFIEKAEEFIRRNLAGGDFRASQAQARQKALEKLERIERPRAPKKIHLYLDAKHQSGQRVLRARDLAVGYGDSVLVRCGDLHLQRGERAALIGPNGSGKSTLLRTILGEIPPLQSAIELGHNVQIGYFRQSQTESADADKTVLEVILESKDETISAARNYLGQFLFSGDDVFKKISELSGGERSRVALAQLAQLGGNLLLLDEPTNHLDIDSREVLQAVLKEYTGTILLVSHDRYLIRALATQIWEIRDGKLYIYSGDYESYRWERAQESATEERQTGSERESSQKKSEERLRSPGKVQRQRERQRAKLVARESELIAHVSALEREITQLERKMEDLSYAGEHERLRELTAHYQQKRAELESASEQWAQAADELTRGSPETT